MAMFIFDQVALGKEVVPADAVMVGVLRENKGWQVKFSFLCTFSNDTYTLVGPSIEIAASKAIEFILKALSTISLPSTPSLPFLPGTQNEAKRGRAAVVQLLNKCVTHPRLERTFLLSRRRHTQPLQMLNDIGVVQQGLVRTADDLAHVTEIRLQLLDIRRHIPHAQPKSPQYG